MQIEAIYGQNCAAAGLRTQLCLETNSMERWEACRPDSALPRGAKPSAVSGLSFSPELEVILKCLVEIKLVLISQRKI
jgi:hypothetical protein